MTDKPRSRKQERARLVANLRRQGGTWADIAEQVRIRYRVNARVALRLARGWSQREVADRWNTRWPDQPKTFKNVSYWEVWPSPTGHEPSLAVLDRLAQLYECSVRDLLADLPDHHDQHTTPVAAHHDSGPGREPDALAAETASDCRAAAELPWPHTDQDDPKDAMERRRLLHWAAASLGAGTLGGSAEPVRQLLDAALTDAQRTLEDWQVTCADHLHAIRTRPATRVRDDLAVDLLALHRQLQATPTDQETTEIHRITAMLAMIYANALTRLGDHGPAIRWWRTARAAADTSQDLELCLLVRAAEAGFGLYGQRDIHTVLTLTENTRRIAGIMPSVGLATTLATEAKALSMLGRNAEARRALGALIDLAETGVPGSGPSFWTADQVHFTESWVYASAGDETACDQARDKIIKYPLDYQYQVNLQLHQALCTVVNGGVSQGVHQAATIIDALPAGYRSNMINETGRMVLRAVPPDHRAHPAVTEFHTMLAISAPVS